MKKLILAVWLVIIMVSVGWAVSDPVSAPFLSKVPGHEVTGDLEVTGDVTLLGREYALYRDRAEYILISGFETTSEWVDSQPAYSKATDTDAVEQYYSIKYELPANITRAITKTGAWDFTGYYFQIALKFTQNIDQTNLGYIRFYDGIDYVYWNISSTDMPLINNEWHILTSSLSNISTSTDWRNITQISIQIKMGAGYTSDLYIDSFKAIKTFPIPMVVLRFDDGYDSDFLYAKSILGKYGYRGVFFIPTSQVGTSGRVTAAQLQTMDNMGNDIACHTHSHTALDTLTAIQQRQEMIRCVRELHLLDIYKGPRFLAFPSGQNDDVDANTKTLTARYFLAGFSTYSGQSNPWQIENPWYQMGYFTYDDVDDISMAKTAIDNLATYNGILSLGFHKVVSSATTPTGLQIRENYLEDIIDYINSKGIAVVTYSDIVDNIVQSSHAPLSVWDDELVSNKDSTNDAETLSRAEQGLVNVDTGTAFSLKLPAAPIDGDYYEFFKTTADANVFTLDGNGNNVNGAATYTAVDAQYDSVKVRFDATSDKWWVVSKIVN